MNDRIRSTELLARNKDASVRLDFIEKPLFAKQRRLQNRTVLEPQIDLNAYRCRAVIDWADFSVMTVQPTQWQWVQRRVVEAIGRKCHVKRIKLPDGTSYRRFTLRFQEPDVQMLRLAEEAIESRWGLAMPATCENLEVSVDFRPKTPSDEALARLYGILVRSHLPGRDVMENPRDRPRYSFGSGPGQAEHVLAFRKNRPEKSDELLLQTDLDRPVPFDCTYHLGAKESCCSWRAMVKTLDRQNRPKGTHVELTEKDRRVRIEVTLGREELEAIGLTTLEDLRNFRFQTFQGRYFQFALPTFADLDNAPAGTATTVARALEETRRKRFLNAGVLGLIAFDSAHARIRKARRSETRGALARPLRPVRRSGTGCRSTTAAYQELTRRVLTALRHLGKRVLVSDDLADD